MQRQKMPRDLQYQCLGIVRGYERVKREYNERRKDILESSGAHYTTYEVKGEERRAFLPGNHTARRSTEDRQMQLEGLEHMLAYKQMHAVEHALDRIGAGLPEMIADYLRGAIYKNCIDGRKYTFERLYTIGVSRSAFYRYREAFFWDIANELGLF